MGWNYRQRVKVCKGVYINVGKKGVTSVSGKIGNVTVNSKGKVTASLPGTGISYTTDFNPNNTQPKKRSLLFFLFSPTWIMTKLAVKMCIFTFKLMFLPFILMFKLFR